MKKRLRRYPNDGVALGVLAGLADYFDHDVVLYRVLAVVGFILTGLFPGVLLYVGAYLVMPAGVKEAEVEYRVVD